MKRVAALLLSSALVVTGCVSLGPGSAPVAVENASFELPATEGNGLDSTGWTSGGKAFGRFRYPSWVADGEWAAWSGYDGGVDNGYSQQLLTSFVPGSYRLTVAVAGADPLGGVSRIILGYPDEAGRIVELGYSDKPTEKMTWASQSLNLEVVDGSSAVGRPIWIRLTCAAMGSVKGQAGNIWDKVVLLHVPPKPAKE